MEWKTKEFKAMKVKELRAIDLEEYKLEEVDMRLLTYVRGVSENADGHNLFEVLAVLKFLRLWGEYTFRASRVRRFVMLYESLKFSGMDGRRTYRLTPIQYFQFASMLGFYYWEDIGPEEDAAEAEDIEQIRERKMARADEGGRGADEGADNSVDETDRGADESGRCSDVDGRRGVKAAKVNDAECAKISGKCAKRGDERAISGGKCTNKSGNRKERKRVKKEKVTKKRKTRKVVDGRILVLRRLVRDAILFVPRKFSKTTSTASLAVNELFFGDANAQAYTAANSYKQAKICFGEISKIVRQLDPKKRYFKATRETLNWKRNNYGKESFVECLTGGGDTKDGLNASLVIFDEYAQAKYVKDHSEGAELLQVLRSSMGTRREPLTIIITTASRVEDGPFGIELENAKKVLLGEFKDDSQFASLFMPDAWEMDEKSLGDPKVWRKCNPHIGVTVQEGFYRSEWAKAQNNAERMLEFKTKMLNIFVSGGVKVWVSQQLARSLQMEFTEENIHGRPMAMAAMDLSVSDDFSTVVYNIYSSSQRMFYLIPHFWIPEETLETHPNSMLYKVWVASGWMKVCPGAVIDSRMIVDDVLRMNEKMTILQVGYDAYKAQEVVNALGAAVSAEGGNPEKILKAVPQTYGAFTSPVETLELAAKSNPPRLAMDMNPILPYCFGNCYLDENPMGNKKPLKRKENLKIDGAIAALMTFWMYNNYES